ncbi:MAG: energy transducer TonB [Muribaculaceae bacterium]
MSYNFNYPENSSSLIVTIAIGVVISILTFILLYNNTNANYNWSEQSTASAQVDESDLGCEVEDEASTVEQPYKPTTSTSSSSSAQELPATTSSHQQQTTSTQQQQTPAQQPSVSDSKKYTLGEIDVNPEFPGGTGNLRTWLSNNLKYPAQALQDGIEGTVRVQFTVFKDGHVGDVKVVGSVHPALDAEAKRLIGIMPNWTPGKLNGQTVNVTYILPIKFVM